MIAPVTDSRHQKVEGDLWPGLTAELDVWAATNRTVTLWWRDDDAAAPTPALDRLIALAAAFKVPLALAVIPAQMDSALAGTLAPATNISVLQHGYAHVNHAPRGQGLGAWELGDHRPLDVVLTELETGRQILSRFFGDRFAAALVPPWNRIDATVAENLPRAGLFGLSTFGPRPLAKLSDLCQVNTHADVLRWKKGIVRYAGDEKLAGELVAHLRARRLGLVDADEPSGLLTHHLEMTEDAWHGMVSLLSHLTNHPARIQWCAASDLFSGPA